MNLVGNRTTVFTKNLPGPLFEKHTSDYVGNDEYYKNTKRIKGRVPLLLKEVRDGATMSKSETNLSGIDSEYYCVWNSNLL